MHTSDYFKLNLRIISSKAEVGRLFEKSAIYVKIEPERLMKIETGESVILVLHTPREKLLGILSEIGSAGIFVRAIDLGYFDDWCSSIAKKEPYLRMSDYFFPMWRLERLTRDEDSPELPSMAEEFKRRTGKTFGEI